MENNETSKVYIDVLELNTSVQKIDSSVNSMIQKRITPKAGIATAIGFSLAVSITSPATSIQISQAFSDANVITYHVQQQKTSAGRRISRAEALALCQKIAEDAERERQEIAEWEAQHGIPREIYS